MSSGNLQTGHLEAHDRINTETPHERLKNDSEINKVVREISWTNVLEHEIAIVKGNPSVSGVAATPSIFSGHALGCVHAALGRRLKSGYKPYHPSPRHYRDYFILNVVVGTSMLKYQHGAAEHYHSGCKRT